MIVYPPIPPVRKVSLSNNNNNMNNCNVSGLTSTSSGVNRTSGGSGSVNNKRQTAHVQWRHTNVQNGVVKVDKTQLFNLIKTEPIQKFYDMDTEPFAQGAFASVRRVRSLETGQVYAAKFSSRTRYGEDSTDEIYHEIALLSLCSPSPRIVKLHDVFQTQNEIIIVMEFAPGGDMQTIIDDNIVPFEADVVRFMQHIVEGLAYMHQRKIAHLDIKPQNLVMMGDFPDCDVKVCDFEISRVILDGTQIRELLGTPEYVAPEILHYEPITLAADMWSLGVTVYVLLTGFSPFGGETDQETFLNISQARLDFPEELFEDVSENAIDFVKKLLVRNPSERMTAKECLRHPWLANNKKKTNNKKQSTNTSTTDLNRNRVGCSSCTSTASGHSHNNQHHQQNLRKYLSKSREALFERVISKHKQHSVEHQIGGQSLRKSTLLSQYDKTRRMCESQMSLVSKSRERLLQGTMMSPSITRSREKLYGLKSLSKSHEVLNLCKTVSALASSGDGKKPLEGLLKTLTRAATASGDLTTRNTIEAPMRNNDNDDDSSNKEIVTVVTDIDNKEVVLEDSKEIQQKKEPVIASLPTLPEYQPLQTVLTLISNNTNNDFSAKTVDIEVDDNKENVIETTMDDVAKEVVDEKRVTRPKLCIMKQLSVISSEGDGDLNSPAVSQTDSLSLTEGNSSINSSDSDISEEDNDPGSLERLSQGDISDGFENDDHDEPRYTVKQLISAYNIHQEIVTKTSLEVTMSITSPEQKILPVIEKIPNQKFPTGPNALRLFIPDLHISRKKRTTKRRHSMKVDEEESATSGKTHELSNTETDETKHSTKPTTINSVETKQYNLTIEQPKYTTTYNRSNSLSSECDKTSGVSSTLTSSEELNPNLNDNKTQQKRSSISVNTIRSNRSSGVASTDSDTNDIYENKNVLNSVTNVCTSTNESISTINVPLTSTNNNILPTMNKTPNQQQKSTNSSTNNMRTTQSVINKPTIEVVTASSKNSTNNTTTSTTNTKTTDRLNVNCTYTPRMNRKSFPSTRTPSQQTEKTRRKSNPVMKPPFY